MAISKIDNKKCAHCGNEMQKKRKESYKQWLVKRFCSTTCKGKENKVLFKKGHTPWHKGLKVGHLIPTCFKKGEARVRGENNFNWKGGRPKCQKCSKEISYKKIFCKSCVAIGSRNPRWKGGYENRLWHNRQRRARLKGSVGSFSQVEWEAMKMKFRYMCLCCKKTEPEITLSVDHILPLSKGGTNEISNIQPLCRSCNSRKRASIISFVPILCQ